MANLVAVTGTTESVSPLHFAKWQRIMITENFIVAPGKGNFSQFKQFFGLPEHPYPQPSFHQHLVCRKHGELRILPCLDQHITVSVRRCKTNSVSLLIAEPIITENRDVGRNELPKPAGSPSVGNPSGVCMHCRLHIHPVVVLLGVGLCAGVVAEGSPADEGVLEPQHGGVGGRGGAGRRVDAVLVNVAELVVHGVVDGAVAGARDVDAGEVARPEDGLVGAVGDHGVCPPVGDRADVVVVVVSDCVAHLSTGEIIVFFSPG
jgi:hypothetical protein